MNISDLITELYCKIDDARPDLGLSKVLAVAINRQNQIFRIVVILGAIHSILIIPKSGKS